MTIGIIDVGIGNIGSLQGALYSQGWDTRTVRSPADMEGVTHLFLPGVGSFFAAMVRLNATGLTQSVKSYAAAGGLIMGICLGMQLLADSGEEGGGTGGLGLIAGKVMRMERFSKLRLPHMGWNVLNSERAHPLLEGIREGVDFYFVHSYFFNATHDSCIVGTTEYGGRFPTFIATGNVVGVQFHPEKSQRNGLRLLDNFCRWEGTC